MHSSKKGILFFLSAFFLGCHSSNNPEASRSNHYSDSTKVEAVLKMVASDTFRFREIRQKINDLSNDPFEIYDRTSAVTTNGLLIHAEDTSDYTLFTGSAQFRKLKKYDYKGYTIWKDESDKSAPRYALEPHPTLGWVLTVRNITN